MIDSQGNIAETDETNNVAYETAGQFFALALGDLWPDAAHVSSGFTPLDVTAGATAFEVAVFVRSDGITADNTHRVSFYASQDQSITVADHLLGSTDTAHTSGVHSLVEWAGAFPASVPAGSYWVGWIIDSSNSIPESDEGNNAGYDASGQLMVSSDGTTGGYSTGGIGCTSSNTGKGPMSMLVIWPAFVVWLTLRRRSSAAAE